MFAKTCNAVVANTEKGIGPTKDLVRAGIKQQVVNENVGKK
jgi:hypothetical protein